MAARTPLPFLYHTRTILRRPRTSTFACPLPKCFGSTSEPRAHQNEVNVQQTRPKTHKGHGPDINIRSSITPTERKAFEAILRSSKPPENVQSQPALVDATDIDVDNILEMFGTFIKSQHDISHTSTSPVETSPDHDNPSSSTSKSGPHEGDDSVTMAIVHRQMHEIVEALQQAAASTQQPGDIALWHACEARVFSLGQGFHQQPIYHPPKFLGPRNSPSPPTTRTCRSRFWKRNRSATERNSRPKNTTARLRITSSHLLHTTQQRAALARARSHTRPSSSSRRTASFISRGLALRTAALRPDLPFLPFRLQPAPTYSRVGPYKLRPRRLDTVLQFPHVPKMAPALIAARNPPAPVGDGTGRCRVQRRDRPCHWSDRQRAA